MICSILITNRNLVWKSVRVLVLFLCSWLSINVCIGYLLAQCFYNFFDKINRPSIYNIIKFRKKFSLKTIKKIIIDPILKFLVDWIIELFAKYLVVLDGQDKLLDTLKIYIRRFKTKKFIRFKFRSILKSKSHARRVKALLYSLWKYFGLISFFISHLTFWNMEYEYNIYKI